MYINIYNYILFTCFLLQPVNHRLVPLWGSRFDLARAEQGELQKLGELQGCRADTGTGALYTGW